MTVEEIDRQINELRGERNKLRKEQIAQFKEEAKVHIGRCFRINYNGTYAKVIDVPQEKYSISGENFNEYQFPALYLTTDAVPFYYDTLFSAAWGDGHDVINTYEEITPEEFAAEFEKRVKTFRDFVFGGAE